MTPATRADSRKLDGELVRLITEFVPGVNYFHSATTTTPPRRLMFSWAPQGA